MKQKLLYVASTVTAILMADVWTKRWALGALDHGQTVDLAGLVPLTLAFNTGIVFGLPVPSTARWVLIVASVIVVVMLAGLFRNARRDDWVRLSALSLVMAGAVGNLIDRVRWDLGVVDFIGPFDLGFMHWPIFNVADMAITVGALLLGVSLWREDAVTAAAAPLLEANAGLEES